MSFVNLNLQPTLLKALTQEGYTSPTPIQSKAIPVILEGKDIIAAAQTGTGKTAAFALPILQLLSQEENTAPGKKFIKSLILTPTRELAAQISESFHSYGRYTSIRNITIYGGVSQRPQESALRSGADVLIATPGRLQDLMEQRLVNLSRVKIFVLDEADRMLDMGFIHAVKKIITHLPPQKQTLFFSATMPKEIARLAKDILVDPVEVSVTPVSSTAEKIEQSLYFVEKNNKRQLLLHLLKNEAISSALVFTRTKHGADRVVKDMAQAGIHAEAIHGNKSQQARIRALHNFKTGKTKILVATDIAARGIDVEELSHVINYELPNIAETYVHRIGRTGRAGRSGIALSFCDAEERDYLKDIQKLINRPITVIDDHPFESTVPHQIKKMDNRRPLRGSSTGTRSYAPARRQLQRS